MFLIVFGILSCVFLDVFWFEFGAVVFLLDEASSVRRAEFGSEFEMIDPLVLLLREVTVPDLDVCSKSPPGVLL